jgi:hypothetical protein
VRPSRAAFIESLRLISQSLRRGYPKTRARLEDAPHFCGCGLTVLLCVAGSTSPHHRNLQECARVYALRGAIFTVGIDSPSLSLTALTVPRHPHRLNITAPPAAQDQTAAQEKNLLSFFNEDGNLQSDAELKAAASVRVPLFVTSPKRPCEISYRRGDRVTQRRVRDKGAQD